MLLQLPEPVERPQRASFWPPGVPTAGTLRSSSSNGTGAMLLLLLLLLLLLTEALDDEAIVRAMADPLERATWVKALL